MNEPKVISLTDAEKQTIQSFGDTNQQFVFEAGRLTLARLDIIRAEKDLANRYQATQDEYKTFLSNLEQKYGAGILDMVKGTFTPAATKQ